MENREVICRYCHAKFSSISKEMEPVECPVCNKQFYFVNNVSIDIDEFEECKFSPTKKCYTLKTVIVSLLISYIVSCVIIIMILSLTINRIKNIASSRIDEIGSEISILINQQKNTQQQIDAVDSMISNSQEQLQTLNKEIISLKKQIHGHELIIEEIWKSNVESDILSVDIGDPNQSKVTKTNTSSAFDYVELVSWDASSRLLPSNSSIAEKKRFKLNGNASWISFENEAMNIIDNSAVYQLNFQNRSILSSSNYSDWVFQIELRMNSHRRPVFDIGVTTGITFEGRRFILAIAKNSVGFIGNDEFLKGCKYQINTTNYFHVYRVVKTLDVVSLFVDTFDIPVASIKYSDFPVLSDHGTFVDLIQTSNPGIVDFDVKSFSLYAVQKKNEKE